MFSLISFSTKSMPPCWKPPRRFHFAAPEVNGFGVTTLTPGLTRSSQVLMSFGLPLRTMNETSEFVTKPSCSALFQSSATRPASTSL